MTTYTSPIQADVPTSNGRIYPRKVLQKAIGVFNGQALRVALLEPNSQDLESNFDKLTHYVNTVWIDTDGFLQADLTSTDDHQVANFPNPDEMYANSLEFTPVATASLSDDGVINDDLVISHFAFYKESNLLETIEPYMDSFKDVAVPKEPFMISWSKKGIGSGEFWFYVMDGVLVCDNETMSKDTIKEILCNMVDNCTLQS